MCQLRTCAWTTDPQHNLRPFRPFLRCMTLQKVTGQSAKMQYCQIGGSGDRFAPQKVGFTALQTALKSARLYHLQKQALHASRCCWLQWPITNLKVPCRPHIERHCFDKTAQISACPSDSRLAGTFRACPCVFSQGRSQRAAIRPSESAGKRHAARPSDLPDLAYFIISFSMCFQCFQCLTA